MMNKDFFGFYLFFVISINVFSQNNLIKNPSFEEYYACPSQLGQLELSKYWVNPNKDISTPGNPLTVSEYFNRCSSNSNVSVPENLWNSYQEPKDGDAVFEARALLTWYDSIGTRYINPCEGIYIANNRIAGENNADTENNYSLSKDAKEALISLYPNPANSYVDIVNITTLSYLQIYAHNGTLVLSKEISGNKETERIEIYNLPTGLYVYLIVNSNQEALVKGKLSIIK